MISGITAATAMMIMMMVIIIIIIIIIIFILRPWLRFVISILVYNDRTF